MSEIIDDFRNVSISPINTQNVNMLTNEQNRGAVPKKSLVSVPQPTNAVDKHPQGILRSTNIIQPHIQQTVHDLSPSYSEFIRAPRNPISVDKNATNNFNEQYRTNDYLNNSLRLNSQPKHQYYKNIPQNNRVRFTETNLPSTEVLGTHHNRNTSFYRRSPIASWGLNFSGNVGGQSLNDFLDKVNLYAQADGINSVDLLRSAVYLFSGSALTWFQAFGTAYRTWEELVSAMRTMFLTPDYDYELLQEILHRKQGVGESFGVYIANMEMLYRQLESITVTEQRKLDTIIRNMIPSLAEKIILIDITSIQQLARLCRKIESFNFKTNRVQNTSQNNVLEPRFSIYKPSQLPQQKQQISLIENTKPKRLYPRPQFTPFVESETFTPRNILQRPGEDLIECWNCLNKGHDYMQCKQPKLRIFCFNCGEIGQVATHCRNCKKNGEGGAVRNFQSSQYRKPQF